MANANMNGRCRPGKTWLRRETGFLDFHQGDAGTSMVEFIFEDGAIHMTAAGSNAKLSDLRSLLGEVNDDKLMAIMALEPTIEEIEEAVTWVDEGIEVRPNGKWPIQGKVAEICDILVADTDDDELQ